MDLTCVLKQSSTITSTTTTATFQVRDGWLTGEIRVVAAAAGSAGSQIKLTVTGLPAARSSTATNSLNRGWYRYSRVGVNNLRGPVRWDGVDLLPTDLGISPSFAVASTDILSIFLKFPVA